MKPFQLDAVLTHRKRMEDIAASRLFNAKRQKKIVQQKLQEQNITLQFLIEKNEELQSNTMPVLDLISYENQIHFLEKNIGEIKKNLHQKTVILQNEQENLITKSKERQIMESLKEQQNRTWKEYLDKKEVSLLDEISTVRHDTGR
jgi:flagellar export protein FliJ